MKDIAIVGAGGLGREMLVMLHQLNEAQPAQWNILGFYDDDTSLAGTAINCFPYLGTITALASTDYELQVVIAIGNPQIKRAIVTQLELNVKISFPTLVHPQVQVKPYQHIQLGTGVVLAQGTILTTNISIGKHVFVNLNCTIGHDAILKDFVSVMPGVNISGAVVLETGVYVGTNAAILQGINVGANTQIGAGAVVTKPMPAGCTAVGVPAKVVKT
ncbi:acetyltransferase [Pontibacter harenae]|uniref:acetyltransferase n=1 Tax=Pontibacter harenae TaxID=2894083 RepID=UPI001E4E4B74|nr:acetyltransferase [Pontibacter harenae]MCC9166065.1 acetyltransferase [Pontibacter harenae]